MDGHRRHRPLHDRAGRLPAGERAERAGAARRRRRVSSPPTLAVPGRPAPARSPASRACTTSRPPGRSRVPARVEHARGGGPAADEDGVGVGQAGEGLGASPVTHVETRHAEPRGVAARSARPARPSARPRRRGTWGRCASTRCRPSRRRRRRPRAARRAAAPAGPGPSARRSRLVSWPSCSNASSGRPGHQRQCAGLRVRDQRRRHSTLQGRRVDGPPGRRRSRRDATRRATPGRRAPSPRWRRTRPATSSAATTSGVRPSEDSTSSRRPGAEEPAHRVVVAADQRHDVGGLRRPAHPGAGQRHRRERRMDVDTLRSPSRATRVVRDARDERVARRRAPRPASRRASRSAPAATTAGATATARAPRPVTGTQARWRRPPSSTSARRTRSREVAERPSQPSAPMPTTVTRGVARALMGGHPRASPAHRLRRETALSTTVGHALRCPRQFRPRCPSRGESGSR